MRSICLITLRCLRPFLILVLLVEAVQVKAQSSADSLNRKHSPVRASIYSALLPGAGQVYNRKYWKVPVIYGAMAGLGYLAKFNHDKYTDYRNAYRLRVDGLPETLDAYTELYSDNDLKLLRDYYRRNRDLSLIFGGLVYVLNIVDASVDAHLFYFDVSDDLSLQLSPAFLSLQTAGISFAVKF